jgi:hypothetical protein
MSIIKPLLFDLVRTIIDEALRHSALSRVAEIHARSQVNSTPPVVPASTPKSALLGQGRCAPKNQNARAGYRPHPEAFGEDR